MKLGLNLGYWGLGGDVDNVALAREADRLGYAVCWAAEAYGSDVVTVLTWVAAHTQRIDIGSGIMQIPARTPTMTAMTAATLDTLSGGRFRLGVGLSGPQVSEGWHGVRYDRPLARTREYVDIVRLALSRRTVRYDGATYQLPLPDGPGKALHLMVRPVQDSIPIYIASIGPKNLELTGEIADGWLGVFFSPDHAAESLEHIAAGRAKAGRTMSGFEVVPTVPLAVDDDLPAAIDLVRPYAALYVGGMGSREQNFYNNLACRMGFAEAAARVQELYLSRDYAAAAAAVPADFVDATSLVGTPSRIAERMAQFARSGVTTLTVSPFGRTLDEKLRSLEVALGALHAAGAADDPPPSERPSGGLDEHATVS